MPPDPEKWLEAYRAEVKEEAESIAEEFGEESAIGQYTAWRLARLNRWETP
jgi:hypothetical protein